LKVIEGDSMENESRNDTVGKEVLSEGLKSRLSEIERNVAILKALDILSVALATHDHVWNEEERRLYESADSLLS